MKSWRIGKGTVALGLIAAGVLMILNTTGKLTNEVFQYLGPALIIIFGLEVIWSLFFKPADGVRRYSVWSIILLLIVFFISLSPNSITWQPSYVSPVHGQMAIDNTITNVNVQIPDGKVQITGTKEQTLSYEGELSVNAASQANSDQIIQADWKVQRNGNTVELILDQPDQKFNILRLLRWTQKSPYLIIHVPEALITKVGTKNGGLTVENMNADTNIKSTNGTVSVKNVRGSVVAVTSNGSSSVTDIEGTVDVRTSNGSVNIANITGAVRAHSSNGAIDGSSAVGGSWDISTSNGRITLTIPEASNAKIDASTSNGSIGGDLTWQSGDKNHRSSTIGTGANAITLATSNGSVKVIFAK